MPCEKVLCLDKELQEEAGPGAQCAKLCIVPVTANATRGVGVAAVIEKSKLKINFGGRYY